MSGIAGSRDFILPLRNGSDLPSKPPLFHWLAYGAGCVTGTLDEFAVRLPSAVTAVFTALIIFVFCSYAGGLQAGWLAVGILCTAFEFIRSAGHARVDMTFALFLTASFISLHMLLSPAVGRTPRNAFWTLFAAAAISLAVLAKGPAGLLLPGAAAFFFVLLLQLSGQTRRSIRPFLLLVLIFGAALFAAGSWYAAAYHRGGEAFVQKQLLGENIARVVELSGYNPGHEQPFYFSLVDLAVGFFPWSLLLPGVLVWLWKERNELFKRPLLLHAVVWSLLFLAAVSISSSKREVYLLPVYPQLSLLAAYALRETKSPQIIRIVTSPVLIVLAAGLLAAVGSAVFLDTISLQGLFHLKERDMLYVNSVVQELRSPGTLILTLTAALLLFFSGRAFLQSRLVGGALLLSLSMFVLGGVVNYRLQPRVSSVASPVAFMEEVKRRVSAEDLIYQYAEDFYAALFYAGRTIPFTAAGAELREAGKGYVLARSDAAARVERDLPGAAPILSSETLAANGRARLTLFAYKGPGRQ